MPWRSTSLAILLAGLAVWPACSGGSRPATSGQPEAGPEAAAPEASSEGGAGDAGDASDAPVEAAPTYPASTPNPPLVQNSGGAVVTTPRIVPVFFTGEPQASILTDAITKYTTSSAWHAAVSEYGVGAAMVAPAVNVTTALPSPMTSDDLGAWLGGQLYDGTSTASWGPVDAATIASTVFVLFPPDGVTVYAPGYDGTGGQDPTLCGPRPWDPTGWHWQTVPAIGPSAPVVFAVVGRCSYDATPVLDRMTATISHELAEATTDPTPITAPAYADVDDAHAFWSYYVTGGGEIGDLCGQDASQLFAPADVGYMVQRVWSNAAASAGHDPCVPAAGPAYFDVSADMPDTFYDSFVQAYVGGVSIPAGGSRTIDVRLLSDGPTDPWSLTALDPYAAPGGSSLLELTLDGATGQNGDVRHLTIKPLVSGHGSTTLYEIDSTLHGVTHCWYGEIAIE
jgi:hypothetical protein